jgi:hypothetical protein
MRTKPRGNTWSRKRRKNSDAVTVITGNEIVYIQDGSVIFEAQGKPAVTLKPGEAFTTVAGEVHNVKNASSSAPAKALARGIRAQFTARRGIRNWCNRVVFGNHTHHG